MVRTIMIHEEYDVWKYDVSCGKYEKMHGPNMMHSDLFVLKPIWCMNQFDVNLKHLLSSQ